MAKVVCVLYDDPIGGYPKSYARDDIPRLERYPGGQTLNRRETKINPTHLRPGRHFDQGGRSTSGKRNFPEASVVAEATPGPPVEDSVSRVFDRGSRTCMPHCQTPAGEGLREARITVGSSNRKNSEGHSCS